MVSDLILKRAILKAETERDEEEYQRNFNKKMMAYAERLFLTMDLEADKSADCLIKAFKDHVKEQDEEKRDD